VALLRVADTGIGIPAKDLPFVFDKFFRVRSAATSDIAGTGLGLAIARGIVEAHRGRIWVESEEGRGSTFAFTIPLDEGAAPPRA
jgi:signal transduction histidine kinase